MNPSSLLKGFAFLLILQWISTQIIALLQIPFPPPLLAMLLLTGLLCTGIVHENQIDHICEALIEKMSMLFLPASVSMILYLDIITAELVPILIIVCVSSILVLSCTALVLEFFLRRQEKGGQNHVS